MKTINFDLEEVYKNLLKEAEGAGFEGMLQPIWAEIENGVLTLSIGAPVSRNTSFVNPNGSVAKSWVGNVECWKFTGTPEDYKDYGFENPEDFDREYLVESEVEQFIRYADLEQVKEDIQTFCEGKGYEVEFI